MPDLHPCLWFDTQAQEAAEFYVSIFPNSKVHTESAYSEAGQEVHGQAAGSVMSVDFELDGQRFMALNGGPAFSFNEAVSFVVPCDSQAEIDRYWEALIDRSRGAGQCGWLKDKFGLSWQIVPRNMDELLGDQTTEAGRRAMKAMLTMQKLDIAALAEARSGLSAAPSRSES